MNENFFEKNILIKERFAKGNAWTILFLPPKHEHDFCLLIQKWNKERRKKISPRGTKLR